MRREIVSSALGALLAIAAAVATMPGAGSYFRHSLGLWDEKASRGELVATITAFNQYYAKFFDTGGDLDGLHLFPASNLLKRRMVQDINSWSEMGLVLVHDKFGLEVDSITILSPEKAVAVTSESWALMVRSRDGREAPRGTQSLNIRVRYILERKSGAWTVSDFDVYSPQDEVPPFTRRPRGI